MRSPDEESQGPVIRDRRRIDPETGQVRDQGQAGPGRQTPSQPASGQGAGQSGPAPAAAGDPASPGRGQPDGDAKLATALAERTADLQRLQAEYQNYRKRVDRDRMIVREQALANVLTELLPVLDDVGRAREHGELTGGFKSVADSLESIVTKLGLISYGEAGDPFDPNLHEALTHSYSPDVTETTCVGILQPGYKVGDRILRPARVAVADPAEADGDDADGSSPDSDAAADGDRPDDPATD
jgi:molecular chaperone GrpE